VERLVVLTPGKEITVSHLPAFLRREHPPIDMLNIELPAQGISLEAIEKELILKALEKFKWNQTHAAKYLDISRKALMYRMEKHGIQRPDHATPEEEEAEEGSE
jgi:DNA-binding NtrC family response regulator